MMGNDTLTANSLCIPEAIRQAGYPSLATQTENDLAALSRAQTEQLGEGQRQHEDTLVALRTIVDAIEREDAPAFRDSHYSDEDMALLVRARDVLTEAG